MEEIVIAEDDLRLLEKRFGSAVRLMGPWNSDGTFGYLSVRLSVIRKAAEDLANADVNLSWLTYMPESNKPFLEMLYTFGSALVVAIVAAYREESPHSRALAPSVSPKAAEPRSLVRTAAA